MTTPARQSLEGPGDPLQRRPDISKARELLDWEPGIQLEAGLRQVIDAQIDSPHELHVLNGFGHVPTNNEGPANDIVDDFIADVLATNPPPFGSD